ncbi:MAG: hypothetical protein HY403_07530 [Elusimicrobia bacterium]|nr:hypothetical protein [Elusimicrobiota bacterium]
MIAKDLLPWMFVKKTATWTPYVKIRSEASRREPVLSARSARRLRRPPRG